MGNTRSTSPCCISSSGNNPCSLSAVGTLDCVHAYDSWRQVAGYFDGEGTIYFSDTSNRPYKLSISLVFVDQSVDQINMIREFLNRHGVRTSNVLKRSDARAYELAASQFASVKKALRRMAPFLHKKEIEARATLEYYNGKITGDQLVSVFGSEVEAGRRERKIRAVALAVPFTRPEGVKVVKQLRRDRLRDAFGRYRARLTPEDFADIRTGYFDNGMRICDLAREYPRYARETIRRVLGKGRRYVGVKGIGRVDTTDTSFRDPRRAPTA